MAILVMLIIIVLNILLLVVVMRIGTQGEHHSELSADQSSSVLTLHDRLGLPRPEPKQISAVQEHSKDVVNTVDPEASVFPTAEEAEKTVVEQDQDEVAKFVNGDDSANPIEQIKVEAGDAEEELQKIADSITGNTDKEDDDSDDSLVDKIKDKVEDIKEEVEEEIDEAKEDIQEVVEDIKEAITGDDDDDDDDDD